MREGREEKEGERWRGEEGGEKKEGEGGRSARIEGQRDKPIPGHLVNYHIMWNFSRQTAVQHNLPLQQVFNYSAEQLTVDRAASPNNLSPFLIDTTAAVLRFDSLATNDSKHSTNQQSTTTTTQKPHKQEGYLLLELGK